MGQTLRPLYPLKKSASCSRNHARTMRAGASPARRLFGLLDQNLDSPAIALSRWWRKLRARYRRATVHVLQAKIFQISDASFRALQVARANANQKCLHLACHAVILPTAFLPHRIF